MEAGYSVLLSFADALDNLNNKLAIQLADKVLKKQKDLHCAKALKALALLRLNREAECIELQEELKKIDVWDDSILQCMTMTYKEMQQRKQFSSLLINIVQIQFIGIAKCLLVTPKKLYLLKIVNIRLLQ